MSHLITSVGTRARQWIHTGAWTSTNRCVNLNTVSTSRVIANHPSANSYSWDWVGEGDLNAEKCEEKSWSNANHGSACSCLLGAAHRRFYTTHRRGLPSSHHAGTVVKHLTERLRCKEFRFRLDVGVDENGSIAPAIADRSDGGARGSVVPRLDFRA